MTELANNNLTSINNLAAAIGSIKGGWCYDIPNAGNWEFCIWDPYYRTVNPDNYVYDYTTHTWTRYTHSASGFVEGSLDSLTAARTINLTHPTQNFIVIPLKYRCDVTHVSGSNISGPVASDGTIRLYTSSMGLEITTECFCTSESYTDDKDDGIGNPFASIKQRIFRPSTGDRPGNSALFSVVEGPVIYKAGTILQCSMQRFGAWKTSMGLYVTFAIIPVV